MIHLDNLKKDFRGRPALHPLTLKVARGEIFGLLGHNGAGKSTTFGMLLGQVRPTAGEAHIDGVSVQRHRARALAKVGAIFETPGFYDYLSGWNNLRIFTSYSTRVSLGEMEETVKLVGLEKRIHEPVRVYSHGMRQRLALAQALLPEPELILLDEPTEGLDPEGIFEIRTLIQRLNRERGLTVVLSSHLLAEVEQMCSRIAILNQGRLVFEGEWADLGTDVATYRLEVESWEAAEPVLLQAGCEIISRGTISLKNGTDIATVVAELVRAGARIHAVEPIRQSLEQIYLEMISKD